jgi:hypothetical protein
MSINYEMICLSRLKFHSKLPYLKFLIKYGSESYQYYKHSIKKSKRLFIYTFNSDITAIIGISDTISIVQSIDRPSWCICKIQFIYCTSESLLYTILKDIDIYANNHNQSQIHITHVTAHQSILINNNYYPDEYDICMYCHMFHNLNVQHDYMKDVVNTPKQFDYGYIYQGQKKLTY